MSAGFYFWPTGLQLVIRISECWKLGRVGLSACVAADPIRFSKCWVLEVWLLIVWQYSQC